MEQLGDGWSIDGEIHELLAHQPFGHRVTRYSIRDYVLGARAVDCTSEELESAILRVEAKFNVVFPEGSLSEEMGSMSVDDMRDQLSSAGRYEPSLTKLDELLLLSGSREET